jgi:hypothetical protein
VLEALFDGAALGVALQRMGADEADPEAVEEAQRSVMAWFRAWMVAGFFQRVEVD